MLNHTFGPYAAIDRLGRKLPLPEKVGTLRENRYVGMFYFINLTWKKGMRPMFPEKMKKKTKVRSRP